ncbi:sulfatase family protein [Pedobacter sp. GSP4]|uniref:sulfatase family protein n=1 Tax=Pedobacter sp. GSP4 TaxID=3453716 RepID=UPI003EE84E0E
MELLKIEMTILKSKIGLLLLIGLCFSGILYAQKTAPPATRPNIIIIISDDHAYQAIGAYGSKLMATPNIDRIAREGATLNKAYVTNSICGPSRAVILTGKYSHKNGFLDNEHSKFDGAQNSFIKELRAQGYLTSWIGKWHLETDPQGFDYWKILPGQGAYYNPDFVNMDGSTKRLNGYVTNVIEDEAEKWLDNRDQSKPFCLVIGHKATHRTWLPDTADLGKFDQVKFPLPANFFDQYQSRVAASQQDMTIAKTMVMGYDLKMFGEAEEEKESTFKRMNEAQRKRMDAYYKPIYNDLISKKLKGKALTKWKYQRYMRDYLSSALALDRNIGRTLDYLDAHNLKDNTLIIYMSDQGFYLGEHGWFDKRWMYEPSFRTPLVMRYPKVIPAATTSNDFVLNLDIAPTVLEAAGIKKPQDMQGESILPLLKSVKKAGRTAVYYHYYENGEHAVSPHFGISTKRYKLIRFYKRVNQWELFDLQKDRNEMHNLYGKKAYAEITEELKKELTALLVKYEDTDAQAILRTEN